MKVAFVITDLDTGGAELALERFVRHLQKSGGFEIAVCSVRPAGMVGERMRRAGIDVTSVGLRSFNLPLGLWRLFRWLRRQRAGVVCSLMFHANLLVRLLRVPARIPALLSFERTMVQESRWRYLLNRMTWRLADRIVAVSPAVKRFCEERIGMAAERVVVLPNWVELERFAAMPDRAATRARLGWAADEFVILCVANFRPIKGHAVLLDAFARFHGRVPRSRLVLIGTGPLEREIEARASGGVELNPYGELVELLAAADIFAMASHTEGMSNAILEAWAAGLPVVVTAAGGNVDVIDDGRTGVLVPVGDSDAIAEAFERMATHPELRAAVSAAAKEAVARDYSEAAVGAQLRALIGSVAR